MAFLFKLGMAVGTSITGHSVRISRGGVSSRGQGPEEFLAYGFRTSATAPNLIDSTLLLFEPRLLEKITYPLMDTNTIISDTMRETASKFSTRSGIDASYGAFSASAKLSTEKLNEKNERKLRVDRLREVYTHKVIRSTVYPHKLLTEETKDYLLLESPENIVETLGEFYAKSIRLGGTLRVTNVLEMSESDDKETLGWEVAVKYGLGNTIGGSTEGSVSSGTFNGNKSINSLWQTLGGESSKWLGLKPDDSNIAEIQTAWQESFTAENSFPVRHELIPIWRILDRVNKTKGGEVETYLKNKWEKEAQTLVDGVINRPEAHV